MSKIRIGVMGCANIAKRSVIPEIISSPELELVAVASRNKKKADDFAQLFNCESIKGYEKLLERDDIDAIYMPLPTGLHDEWIHKCIDAKKHVLAEKSLAENFQSAKSLVKKAKKNKVLLMEDFMFLYHHQHKFIKDKIAQGEIGEIRMFRSSFGFPPFSDKDNFRYKKDLGGGALLDAAAYTIRASQLFLGHDLEIKAANLVIPENSEVDIYGGAYLSSNTNNNVIAQVGFGFDNFYQCNYEIWGSKGKIIAHRSFTPKPNFRPLITIEKQGIKQNYHMAPDNHFYNILQEFTRCIHQEDFEQKYIEVLNQSRLLTELWEKAQSK